MTVNPKESRLKVVLVADDPRQRYALIDLLNNISVPDIKSIHSSHISDIYFSENCVFLIDVAYGIPDCFESWAQREHTSIVCNDRIVDKLSDEEVIRFSYQLRTKLYLARNDVLSQNGKSHNCREVWVLLASTGGPEAITDFMRSVHSGLGIGFVYLQHINDGFDSNLLTMLKHIGNYIPHLAQDGDLIGADEIAIVSGSYQTAFTESGAFVVDKSPWDGMYKPSGNTIIVTLAKSQLPIGGVIVFSGMGNDGVVGARILVNNGGKVWVQSPSSCIIGAMPQSIIDGGLAEFHGTPRDLANRLNERYDKASA